jgi:hypothetical protein
VVAPSGDRRAVDTCLTLITSTVVLQAIGCVLRRGVLRQVVDHCLEGFLLFRVEGILGKVVGFELGFH